MNRVRALVGCNEECVRRYSGRGVGVAILDTGICNNNEELRSRILCFKDMINYKKEPYDESGHGTHVAGIIGGDGRYSGKKYAGVSTGCFFIVLKVLDESGNGNVKEMAEGIDWVIAHKQQYNIRVMNISVGMFPDCERADRMKLIHAVERAWDNGIVVVVAAGNNGPEPMSVTAPGISRKVITVGAMPEKDSVVSTSGRGPTPFCIVKPEVLAPGYHITSCKNAARGYSVKGGTSMATPVVSGAVCLLLEKFPLFTPAEVKIRIHDSSKDLGLPANVQGWGCLHVPSLLMRNHS